MDEELCFLSIGEMAKRFRDRTLSPVEVTDAYLERIARLDGRLHCYLEISADYARAEARRAERAFGGSTAWQPLLGVPIALKDLFDFRGLATTAGSRVLEDRIPDRDADVISKLRAAGSVFLG